MKIRLMIGLILVLSLLLIACGGTTTPERVDEDEIAVQEELEAETPVPQPEIFNIGDTVKMDAIVFTLNSVRWDIGTEYFKPEEGEKWLVVDGTITNNSSETISISSMLMFDLIDDQFYKQELSIMTETKGSLDGELGPGRTMRGEIAYSVNTISKSFELVFSPEIFGYGQAIYSFGVDEIN